MTENFLGRAFGETTKSAPAFTHLIWFRSVGRNIVCESVRRQVSSHAGKDRTGDQRPTGSFCGTGERVFLLFVEDSGDTAIDLVGKSVYRL